MQRTIEKNHAKTALKKFFYWEKISSYAAVLRGKIFYLLASAEKKFLHGLNLLTKIFVIT